MVFSILWDLYKHWSQPKITNEVIFFHDKLLTFCNNHSPIVTCNDKNCYFYNIGRILWYLDQAEHTLDLCMYLISLPTFSEAIVKARKRGVKVRVITDHLHAYNSGSKVIDFLKVGIEVRSRPCDMIMHHKFCIIDYNHPHSCILTGSLNWTKSSVCGCNMDNVIISSDPFMIQPFQNEFNKLWNDFSVNHEYRKFKGFKNKSVTSS